MTLELWADWKNFEGYERQNLKWPQKIVSRRDFEDTGDKVLEESEEHVIGKQRKGNACHRVADSSAKLSPAAKWKAENVRNDLDSLAKEISKQNEEGTT